MSEVMRMVKRSVFFLGVRICEVALAIVVLGCVPAFAVGPLPCGEVTIPQCGGTCPDGQRCIATSDFLLVVTAVATCGPTEPLRSEAAAQNGDCECAVVPCGGVPLAQNQGCCNGRAFTLGTQGCCHGVIVDATQACECGESIDLATTGCCGDTTPFDPALQTCCQQPVTQEGCTGTVSTVSSFNFGFDCCPSAVATASEFCDGRCEGSTCESDAACCQCEECFEAPRCAAGGPTVIEGLPIACLVGCFTQACFQLEATQVDGGTCTEDGRCVRPAVTPAVSRGGMLLAAGLLAATGGLALMRLRKTRGGRAAR